MRVLVYVNENSDKKHIYIHCEIKKPCGDIFKQLLASNTKMTPTISDLSGGSKEAIKIAETENSYWILLYANSCEGIERHQIIQDIAKKLGIAIPSKRFKVHC